MGGEDARGLRMVHVLRLIAFSVIGGLIGVCEGGRRRVDYVTGLMGGVGACGDCWAMGWEVGRRRRRVAWKRALACMRKHVIRLESIRCFARSYATAAFLRSIYSSNLDKDSSLHVVVQVRKSARPRSCG